MTNTLLYSGIGAGIFIAVNSIPTYNKKTQCPEISGRLLNTGVFFGLSVLAMQVSRFFKKSNTNLPLMLSVKYAVYSTMLYIILSSPDMYKLTNGLLGQTSNMMGCPNFRGVVLHGIVFMTVLVLMMLLPKDRVESKYNTI